jgi:hypothetical protein
MTVSWKLCFLSVAKQSFESQVRSQTEFGNEDQLPHDGRSVVLGEHRVDVSDEPRNEAGMFGSCATRLRRAPS